MKSVEIPGLSELTELKGYSYVVTFSGKVFISGGWQSEGSLHEAIWVGQGEMKLEVR